MPKIDNKIASQTVLQLPKVHTPFYRYAVFVAGIVATIAYRILIFVDAKKFSDLYVAIWYAGTLGFVWYFAHRYNIENKRSHLITKARLSAKIANQEKLSDSDRQILLYTINSLQSSMAQWNYVVIFLASGLAMLFDLYMRILAN
jgi:hypothetical protein